MCIDKIKYITTYSANSISELTNDKIQEIIVSFSKGIASLTTNSNQIYASEARANTLNSTKVNVSTIPTKFCLLEFLIKTKSDIDALILLLQQNSKYPRILMCEIRDDKLGQNTFIIW